MSDSKHRQPAARYVEEGAAFAELLNARAVGAAHRERYDVVVIGAGQAGLSVGYHLKQTGLRFLIVDGNQRIGDSWRHRWDSLRLFTPAGYDGLPGMPFPAHPHDFPTKDEMADYLESYAQRFELPVRMGRRVQRLSRIGNQYVLETSGGVLEAEHVVVAMAGYQQPKTPSFAKDLDPGIVQLHSADYKNPSQLNEGGVLLVGAGNTGSELARELAGRHRVWMSGRDVGHIPFRIEGWLGRLLLVRLVLRGLFHHLFTVRTPIGRRMRPTVCSQGGPLVRVKPKDLDALGVERVAKTAGIDNGRPVLEDGTKPDVANVIWCTGFHPDFSWIDLPVFDDEDHIRHDAGVAEGEPGLYFVGLLFLYSLSSTMVHGVGRDAERVVRTIARRARTTRAAPRILAAASAS